MNGKRNIILSVVSRIVVSLMLLAIAAAIYGALYWTRPVPEPADGIRAAPRVQVFPATAVPVSRRWDGFGTATAMDSARVPARVTATVVEVPPELLPGAQVRQGDLLVRLDKTDFERQVEIATQAIADIDAQFLQIEIDTKSWQERGELAADEVRLARAEYDRVIEASEKGAAKQRELDTAKQLMIRAMRDEIAVRTALDQLSPSRAALRARRAGQEALLRIAEQDLQRCEIVSPLDGFVQEVDVEVGEHIQSGQRVARVVSLEHIVVPLRLAAGARPFVATGDQVSLHSTGSTPLEWVAEVSRIAPEDDEATRTMTVYVELTQDPSDARKLVPGNFVRAAVESVEPMARWVVPRRAMQAQRILTVEDRIVRSRGVHVDFQTAGSFGAFALPDTQWVVLRDPLEEGTMIVVNASRSLADGMVIVPFVGAAAQVMSGDADVSKSLRGPDR